MNLPITLTCPLGSKCEEIKDNQLHRCAWFTKLVGNNPQTGENVDESACAISWLPLLQIENTRSGHSTAAAVEALRNEVVDPGSTRNDFNPLKLT